jgi:hypothetical protein
MHACCKRAEAAGKPACCKKEMKADNAKPTGNSTK